MFTGCVTRYKEVTKELNYFEHKDCVKPKRMPLGPVAVVGNEVDMNITRGMMGNATLVVLPFNSKDIVFPEDMYMYSSSGIIEFIKCYVYNITASKKNKVVIADNNSKVKKKVE